VSSYQSPDRTCDALRILLVDDEPAFRESLAEALRDDGHAVDTYESAEAVPSLATRGDVALLITDYQMEGRDGVTLADAFHGYNPDVPVILVSAYQSDDLSERVAARNWLRFVQKSVGYDGLHERIHQLCR